MELYFQTWGKFLTFEGRATRSEYWTFVLVNMILTIVLGFLSPQISAIFGVLTLLPHISVSVRRLNDINLSGWWALLFIPTAIPMLIAACIDSKEENQTIVDNTTKSLAKAVINHSKEFVQEVKPTINNYIEKHNEIVIKNYSKIENNMISENINEDEIYEQVMIEIEENNKVKSTWAKALAQSDGDKNRAESIYIKLRVDFLVQERKEESEVERKKIKEQELLTEVDRLEPKKTEQEKLKEEWIIQRKKDKEKEIVDFFKNYLFIIIIISITYFIYFKLTD